MPKKENRPFSSIDTDGYDRAPSRAMLRAVGFKDSDFKKPQIGIASTWSMVTPCNMHIDKLADQAVNMRRGHWRIMDFVSLSRQALQIFFTIIALKTGFFWSF